MMIIRSSSDDVSGVPILLVMLIVMLPHSERYARPEPRTPLNMIKHNSNAQG